MKRLTTPSIFALVALLVFAGCEGGELDQEATVATMDLPVTTSSEDARRHFLIGLHELDMGRAPEARSHFEQAIERDSSFALAHRYQVFVQPSLEGSLAALERASASKEVASDAEQLMIGITEASLENDAERQLTLARQLTELRPESPRAWMQLAGVLAGMDRTEEARGALEQAIEADSTFAPAHMQLGNSYLTSEPIDLDRAQEAFERAVELAPDEAGPRDLLGDAYRMQGQLEQAAAEYTRASELDPDNALALQQRGHVHTFLGDYEQARADYDSAIALGVDDEPATFAVYRAFARVHEGEPAAAIEELDGLLGRIDGMDLPDPRGARIFALTSKAQIALHEGMLDVAEQALARRAELERAAAEEVGTEQARRTTEADVTLWEARLAARHGDYEAARNGVQEAMDRVEPIQNPTKHQNAHEVLGLISLLQENYEEAVSHYEQGNPNDIYANYHQGLALEGAGRAEEAREMFQKVANWRFNALGLALTRSDATERVAAS